PRAGGHGLEDVLAGRWTPQIAIVADAAFGAAAEDAEKVARLRQARFLAVAARTANALARAADVVLPAASLAQKEGSFTNAQGRVQRFERAFLPPPPARAHWEFLLMLATALGWGDRNWTPADVRALIRSEIEGYGDVTEEELAGGGLMKKGLFVSTGAL
ncbi:MAG TPA: molybdopterin-dependent oxidoreductase, partial [Thermoanaerobaculia bacterium]